MHIIIATDIFGSTDHIRQLGQSLTGPALSVEIISPYQHISPGIAPSFATEDAAYQAFQAFQSQCGIEQYIALISHALITAKGPCVVIGFSVGAACAWKALDQLNELQVQSLIGFYPGQIRHYLDVLPPCPVSLVFACHESYFDVDNIIRQLNKIDQVKCFKSQYLHGFMNPSSINFSAEAAEQFNHIIAHSPHLFDNDSLRRLLLAQVAMP